MLLFRLVPLRFRFVARESIQFAAGGSANILRGALGTIFRRLACLPECPGARLCELRKTCAYARFFEPTAGGPGPSGLADWPRPFVFRAMHLDGQTLVPDATFHFDLNLFVTDGSSVSYFVKAFAQLMGEGLGPGRRRVELVAVDRLNESGEANESLYDAKTGAVGPNPTSIEIDLQPRGSAVHRVLVRFVSPTELKSGGQVAKQPEFGILAARIRDRVSALRELYGEGPLGIEFDAFGERANCVYMTRCEIDWIQTSRRSSRTGQLHSIGGFVGEAEYEGDLSEFLPYFEAARWTGVGRQTVWGKGILEVVTRFD